MASIRPLGCPGERARFVRVGPFGVKQCMLEHPVWAGVGGFVQNTRSFSAFVVVVLALMGAVSPVSAAPTSPTDARTQRLEALDDKERALLAPLLERGPISLVE